MVFDDRLAHAIDLCRRAGSLAVAMRGTLGAHAAKTPIDFCTEADLAVERLIRGELTARFGDAVIGEEDGGARGALTWVVDPIDGTAGYIHDNGRWCVSLALLAGDEIEIGVVYAPATDRMFVARRGAGATLNGRPIRVSRLAHGAAPVVELGWSEREPLDRFCRVLQALTAARMEFRRHGSGALGLAEVACGLSDGYMELHLNAWDALAGILLVREAGGWTNDFLADGGLVHGNLMIASTPDIAETLVGVARDSEAAPGRA